MNTDNKTAFTHQDDVEVHFPTTVLQRQYEGTGSLNDELMDIVKSLETRYGDSEDNAVKSGLISTQGGYQTSTKLNFFEIDHPAVLQFRDDLVMPAVQAYLHEVFSEEGDSLHPWLVGWANLLRAGDWQGPHFHPTEKNLASAVYYIHIPAGKPPPEGCIEFINPHPSSVHHGFPSTRRLHPAEGKMILFPPYYMHYVHPFRGEGERGIIAFDVLAQKPGLQLVF